jgi:hypothetical protein
MSGRYYEDDETVAHAAADDDGPEDRTTMPQVSLHKDIGEEKVHNPSQVY